LWCRAGVAQILNGIQRIGCFPPSSFLRLGQRSRHFILILAWFETSGRQGRDIGQFLARYSIAEPA
jgi:hypothetical protein